VGGRVACAFLMGYGAIRFVIEFFREPDPGIGYQALGLTRGQNFSFATFVAGFVFYVLLRPRGGRGAHEPVGLVDPVASPEAPPA
jgi:phosphatidylglycerol:prolipoprotein diacylglycerol transferase